jgi:methyl-accepting chemotaxis protein
MELLDALKKFSRGDFSVSLQDSFSGLDGEIATAFNEIVKQSSFMCCEFQRTSEVVGKHGDFSQRAALSPPEGCWKTCVDAFNNIIDDMIQPTSELLQIIASVAEGAVRIGLLV